MTDYAAKNRSAAERKRILLIEDKSVFREPLSMALQARGYTVTTAEDGRDALLSLELQQPDLILLDIALPRVDGVTFLARLRGNPGWRAIPVVVLTAGVDAVAQSHINSLGVQGFLMKGDFSLDELQAAVHDVLEKAAAPHLSSDPGMGHGTTLPVGREIRVIDAQPSMPSSGVPPDILQAKEERAAFTAIPRVDGVSSGRSALSTQPTGHGLAELQVAEIGVLARRFRDFEGLSLDSGGSTLAEQQECDRRLEQLLQQNARLREHALKVFGAALFQREFGKIPDLKTLLRQVSPKRVRCITAAIALTELFSGIPPTAQLAFWSHALSVATLLKNLSFRASESEAEDLFAAGLFHDLGELVLQQEFPKDYTKVRGHALKNRTTANEAWQSLMGIQQVQLYGFVLDEFGLPPPIKDPILKYVAHRSTAPIEEATTALISYADTLSHGLGQVHAGGGMLYPVTAEDYRRNTGLSSPLTLESETFRREIQEAARLLVNGGAHEEQQRSPKVTPRIWYARHSSFASLDPVCTFLEQWAEVTIHRYLPAHVGQLKGYDGIVAATPDPEIDILSLFHWRYILSEHPGGAGLYLTGCEPAAHSKANEDVGEVWCYPTPIEVFERFAERILP